MIRWTGLTFAGGVLVSAYLATVVTLALGGEAVANDTVGRLLWVVIAAGSALTVLGLTDATGRGLATAVLAPAAVAAAGLMLIALQAPNPIVLLFGWPVIGAAASVGMFAWAIAYERPLYWSQAIRGLAGSVAAMAILLLALFIGFGLLELARANGWESVVAPALLAIGLIAAVIVGIGVRRRWDDVAWVRSITQRLVVSRREGTFSTKGLPPDVRRMSIATIAASLAMVAVLAPTLVFGRIWTPIVRIPGNLIAEPLPGRVSSWMYIVAIVGVGVASAALAAAGVLLERAAYRRLMLIALGVVGIGIGASIFEIGDWVVLLSDPVSVVPGAWLPILSRVLGIGAMTAALGLLVAAFLPVVRLPWAAALAAAPSVCALVLTITFADHVATMSELGMGGGVWPYEISGFGLAAAAVNGIVGLAGSLVGVLFVSQSIVAARASRRALSRRLATMIARRPAWLFALAGINVAWLALGFLGGIPTLLSGAGGTAWQQARSDSPWEVAIGAVFVALAGAWMLRGARPRASDRGVVPTAAFFAIGFNGPFLASGVLLLLYQVASLASPIAIAPADGLPFLDCLSQVSSNPADPFICAARAAGELIDIAGFATWLVGIAVLAWAALRHRTALAFSFGAVLLWTAPAALSQALGQEIGRPSLLTIDLLLSIVIVVLAVMWWTGRQRTVTPGTLALVLAISALIAAAGTVSPPGGHAIVIGLVLVVTLGYQLLFGSKGSNAATSDRPGRVMSTLGFQLVGLSLLALSIAFDTFASDVDLADLFVPPIVALIVAAEISRRARRPGEVRPAGRPLVRAATWSAGGIVGTVVIVVLVGGIALPPAPVSEGARYRAFLTHVDAAQYQTQVGFKTFKESLSGDDAGKIAAFTGLVAGLPEEERWLQANPPAPCYVDEHARWQALVRAVGAFRDAVLARQDFIPSYQAYLIANDALEPGTSPCLAGLG